MGKGDAHAQDTYAAAKLPPRAARPGAPSVPAKAALLHHPPLLTFF